MRRVLTAEIQPFTVSSVFSALPNPILAVKTTKVGKSRFAIFHFSRPSHPNDRAIFVINFPHGFGSGWSVDNLTTSHINADMVIAARFGVDNDITFLDLVKRNFTAPTQPVSAFLITRGRLLAHRFNDRSNEIGASCGLALFKVFTLPRFGSWRNLIW